MKICNASNDICANCNLMPPKVNGWSYGDICRMDAEDVLSALEHGNLVCYNTDNEKFYEKIIYQTTANYMNEDSDWIYLV